MLIEYKVIEAYESSNEDPIELAVGDKVKITEKSNDNGPWPNWVYCISDITKKEGWVPIQILEMNGEIGIATSNYMARELTVKENEVLVGQYILNGWLWCRHKESNVHGWVPKQNIKKIE